MFDSVLRSLGYVWAEHAYMQALQTVLHHLRWRWPEAVSASLEAAQGGYRLDDAGKALSNALKAWEAQVEQEASEKARSNSRKILELEQHLSELERYEKDKDEKILEMQRLLDNQETTLSTLALKLKTQNVVIAEQHSKLSSIFGEADNSQDTQKYLS
jgi:hypothetical protein